MSEPCLGDDGGVVVVSENGRGETDKAESD